VAFAGVILASVYTLRAFIRAMHNRAGPKVESREMSLGDGLAIVPAVVVIVALAVYPQFPLARSKDSVARSLTNAEQAANPSTSAASATPAQGGTP
jgi:NADH-quinone oxidoreductase subunit M